MQSFKVLLLSLALVAMLGIPFSADAQNRYRWTDQDGSIRISDRIPPDAAQYRIEVLNARGMVVRVIEAQLDEEQRAEAQRQAEQAEQDRLADEARVRNDRMLLQSYTSVADLERARDGRIQALEAQIRVSKSAGARLQDNHDELAAQVARLEAGERPVPADLTARLATAAQQLEANQRFVEAREQERDAILEQFEADIERYKELRGIR